MNDTNTRDVSIVPSRKSPLTQPSPLWGEDKGEGQSSMVRGSPCPSIRNPPALGFSRGKSAIRNSKSGFTYIALLAAIVIIGITLGSAAKSWQNVAQREKEEELLFRGNQYRLAIESYYNYGDRHVFPNTIEVLLQDPKSTTKKHLRKRYRDPITGEDFELIRDMFHGDTIKGVYSKSEKTPIKQAGFPEELKDFEGKTIYSDWKFVKEPTAVPPAGFQKPQGGLIH
jgi:type II secretory pathway pseudopilin PulG